MGTQENHTKFLQLIGSTTENILYNVNASLLDDEQDAQTELIVSRVVPVFFGLVFLTGFLGNILVIVVVLSNPQMRSTTNLLIINLALSDLLFVIFCIPSTGMYTSSLSEKRCYKNLIFYIKAVDYMHPSWPFGVFCCKLVQFFIVVTCMMSVYTLVLMSFDRFLAVVFPIRSMEFRTEKNFGAIIIALWIIIFITSLPVFFSHGLNYYPYKDKVLVQCTFLENEIPGFTRLHFHETFFTVSYLVPVILLIGLYLTMLLKLWNSGMTSNLSSNSQRGKKRVTRLVVAVVLAFVLMWGPIQVILVLKSLGYYTADTHIHIALQICAHVIAYSAACVNPLLYAFLSDNFRKAFKKIVYCNNSRHQQQHFALPTKSTRTASINL